MDNTRIPSRIRGTRMCRKSDLLDAGRYFFDYHHGTYVNWEKKMLFSHQLVDAISADELEQRIADAVPSGEWQLFCLKPPPESVRKKVLERYMSDDPSY